MVRTQEDTSIPIKKTTRERLGNLGNKNESWDRLLNRIMDENESIEKYKQLQEDMEVKEACYKQEIKLLRDEIGQVHTLPFTWKGD